MAEATAIWDYDAQNADEMSLRKNDNVVIIQKFPDDWWKCSKVTSSEVGLVPSNYLFVEMKGEQKHAYIPPGWESTVDNETGDRYYYNKTTGQIQYDLSKIGGDSIYFPVAINKNAMTSGDLREFKRLREEADAKLAALR